MSNIKISMTILMFLAFSTFAFGASNNIIGSASIEVPAVILANNTGELTNLRLIVTKGNGSVFITGPISISNSTNQSALNATIASANFLKINYKNYSFNYIINASNVSGPSAGLAMSLLSISAITGKHLMPNMSLTGVIYANGNVGAVGGVYDKALAVSKKGLKFFIVPEASPGSFVAMLYYLIQNAFSLPIIQVANLSEATKFAFSSNPSIFYSNESSFNLFSNYNASAIPNATLNCINCNESAFEQLANYTINMTQNEINSTSSFKNFKNISMALQESLNQAKLIVRKGYLYFGADLAFLDYANAFYFANYLTSRHQGFETLKSIYSYCNSLTPPQLTRQNYEYVLGGELRQAWGLYTTNISIAQYNLTAVDSDGVLYNMYEAAQAEAWCNAAAKLYNISQNIGGTPVYLSANLSSEAYSALVNISAYAGMYTETAQSAYKNSNYALALLASSYAYIYSMTNKSIPEIANSIQLSNYGVWATQFSNEALFYMNESIIHNSIGDAQEAYSIAQLAKHIGKDMYIINESMLNASNTPTVSSAYLSNLINASNKQYTYLQNEIISEGIAIKEMLIIFAVTILILIIFMIILVCFLIAKVKSLKDLVAKQHNKKR
ncbi:MAG: S16 family serine protease [Candidatus Micrarchaeaceae archaeon]